MEIVVQKFGGTSLTSVSDIKRCARAVADCNDSVVVVVSAMGHFTDHLAEHVSQFAPNFREEDVVLASGEQISAGLFAAALCEIGKKAVSMLGWQVPVVTDSQYSCAKIKDIHLDRILEKLGEGFVVVIPGFQGVCDGNITTLGRSGSDITALALAKALGAKKCDIYTDVNGVFAFDPNVSEQKHLKQIGYQQLLEMSLGGDVLHTRAIDIAWGDGIDVKIASSFDRSCAGTKVARDIEEVFIRGITHKSHRIIVKGQNQKLLNTIYSRNVDVELFFCTGPDTISVVTEVQYTKLIDIKDFEFCYDIAVLNIVGSSSITRSHSVLEIMRILQEVEIKLFSTTEIKLTILIPQKDLSKALNNLYLAFGDKLHTPQELQAV